MRYIPFLFLFLILTIGFAQKRLPFPINTEGAKEYSPAMLPDSSIMLISERKGGAPKCYRFVFEENEWKSSPDYLTSLINSIITPKSTPSFKFSNDFSHLILYRNSFISNQDGYFESKLINGEWSLFKQILKKYKFGRSVAYYSFDNNKLYKAGSNNQVQIFARTKQGWIDSPTISAIPKQINRLYYVIPIGEDGLIYKGGNMDVYKFRRGYFYTKQSATGEWTTPQRIPKLPYTTNSNSFGSGVGLSLTGFDNSFIISVKANIYLVDVPEFIKTEIGKSEKLPLENPIGQQTALISVTEKNSFVKPDGKYYALLIGNSDYELDKLNLTRPVEDVQELYKTLTTYYQFDDANITILLNADRSKILQELYRLRQVISRNDNLLIFYAGHGYWDDQVKQGYWWPTDALPNDPSNWLSNSDLREQISGINSAHTLLISDACFSGGIFKTRGGEEIRNAGKDIQLLYRMPSRRAITSGTLKTVPDNSVFFKYLIKYLTENEKKFISSSELFTTIRASVLNNSLTVPQDGVILNTGDEGGDFIFIKK